MKINIKLFPLATLALIAIIIKTQDSTLLSCPIGQTQQTSERTVKQLTINDFDLDSNNYFSNQISVQSITGTKSDNTIGQMTVFFFHLKSKVNAAEKIYAEIMFDDGSKETGIVVQSITAIKNIVFNDIDIFGQADIDADVDEQLFRSQIYKGFQQLQSSQYLTDFKVNSVADTDAGNWELFDADLSSQDSSDTTIVMKKSETQYYVGASIQSDKWVFDGYILNTKSGSELRCTDQTQCFDKINGDIYISGTLTTETIVDPTAALDTLSMKYSDSISDIRTKDCSIITQIKNNGDSNIYIFISQLPDTLTRTHTFANGNSIRIFSTTYKGDYLQYDGNTFFYLYLSKIQGTDNYETGNTAVNQVILDSSFTQLYSLIQDNSIKQITFSNNRLHMLTDSQIIVVRKPTHTNSTIQFRQISESDGFDIDAKLILNQGLKNWIINPSSSSYFFKIQCSCQEKKVSQMECFENSVCIFVSLITWKQC